MKIDDGEEVEESDHQDARESVAEFMKRVRGDVYNFRRKVEEGTARIDKHAAPAEHDDTTVATIRAFVDRPGETYRNGVASLGIGFARALAARITEARDELNELKIAAKPNEFQAGAIMDAWHSLAMTERFNRVEIPRDSLQILFDDFLSDKARRSAAAARRAEVEPLRQALEHIESTAKRSREQSRRIRWIALRARGGLDGSEEWRTVELPKGTEASKHRMRREAEEAHAQTAEVSARFAAVERELAAYKEFAPAWSPAVSAILYERIRQITVEGFNADHDAKHREGELAKVAGYYALACAWPHERDIGRGTVPSYFPWDRSWWKPKSKMRNLERAAALIIAELDRMMAGNSKPGEEPAESTRTPFVNCRFRECDLPGQCHGEGACHHPKAPA